MKFARYIFLTLVVGIGISATGQSIPSGGVSLIGATDPIPAYSAWVGDTDGSPVLQYRTVTLQEGQFSRAIEVSVINPSLPLWNGQIQMSGQAAVQKGDIALVHFWARATLSNDESGSAEMNVVVERSGGAFTKSLESLARPGLEWVEYFFPITFAESYAAGEYQFAFTFGGGEVRTLQIAGVEFLNYGTSLELKDLPKTAFSYIGRDLDSLWRIEAEQRIQAHRKGVFHIHLKSPDGNPIEGLNVQVKLFKHAFGFGSALQMRKILENSPDAAIYRNKVNELFSSAGPENATKWPALAGEWGGSYATSNTRQALEWLRKQGFQNLRGHVLVWPGLRNLPNYIENMMSTTPADVPGEVLAHIDSAVSEFSPWLNEWDVMNEPFDNHDLMDAFGDPIMIDWFARARLRDPDAGLYLNDYAQLSNHGRDTAHRDETMRVLRYLTDNNAPVTGLGFQGHFEESSLTSISKVQEIIDTYQSEFPDIRFRITEFDILGEDEQLRADYTRDMMTLIFSNPAFDGFQLWGFWEGAIWRPEAAMYDLDWNERPNGTVFRTLVKETWHTEGSVPVNNGTASYPGFYGIYDVAFSWQGIEYRMRVPFEPDQLEYTLQIPDPMELQGETALPVEINQSNEGYRILAHPAESGYSYEILTSTDANTWSPLQEPLQGIDGFIYWMHAPGESASTLYRVVGD